MDKNLVSYKALRFTTESNRSSMMYEVKRARAMWDPSLSVPGTERRGGWRCPVGTRYGGQITDRFGRNCGWGVARRLANEISDIGERLENVGDARRERRVARRNERMAGRLAQGAGAIERLAGRVGDAADLTGRDGGRRNRVGADAPRPVGRLERAAGRLAEAVDPDKPRQGRARRADAPNAPAAPAAPRGRRQVNAEPRPRPQAAQRPRRNLRLSEERRMQREIDNPGAQRTGPGAQPAPAARPRPAAPRRPANAGRRQPAQAPRKPTPAAREATPAAREATPPRTPTPAAREATPARAETTLEQTRRQVAAARAGAGGSDNAARSAEVRAREVEVPDNGFKEQQLRKILDTDFSATTWDENQQWLEHYKNEQGPADMAQWGVQNIDELDSVVRNREESIRNLRSGVREAVRRYQVADAGEKENEAALVQNTNHQLAVLLLMNKQGETRLKELRAMRDGENVAEPNVPTPTPAPRVASVPDTPNATPSQPSRQATPPAPRRIGVNEDVRALGNAEWRQFFEAQNEENIPERVQRAMNAVASGNSAADTDFNGQFNGGGDAMMRIRDRQGMIRTWENRYRELNEEVTRRRRAYEAADPARRDSFRMAQRDLIQAIAHRDRYSERQAEINAVLAQPTPEPLNPEIAAKAEQRVKDAIEKRQQILVKHLDRNYGPGNAPWKDMTPERRAELVQLARTNAEAKNELIRWATAMYTHNEILGSNGKTYRTVVQRVTYSSGEMSLAGNVEVKNADGTWSYIGYYQRAIYANRDNVYNSRFFITEGGEQHKNNGIQTVLNQQAFMYAKAAGFKSFGVTAADDGPYVWGRIGFKDSQSIPRAKVTRMEQQLNDFRAGRPSIIKNEEDANIIQYLIEKHEDNPSSVRHMDFIYALRNDATNQADKRARDTELRNWFVGNMSFSSGTFDLEENLIKADPRD